MELAATRHKLSSSLTVFFGSRLRGAFQRNTVRSFPIRPRATFSASPVSIAAVSDPAAPNASRQNCSRAEAEAALFLMRSMATARMSSSVSLSSISRPLTIAPTGLITSWHTLEHKSAAKSSGAIVTVVKRPILWSMLMRSAGTPGPFPDPSGSLSDSRLAGDTFGKTRDEGVPFHMLGRGPCGDLPLSYRRSVEFRSCKP